MVYEFGAVEKAIYNARNESPLILPQIDPDKNDLDKAKKWFSNISSLGLETIVIGSSLIADNLYAQKLIDIAIDEFDFNILIYIHNMTGLRGRSKKSAVYWSQVPNALNTFFGWDGLIANVFNVSKNDFEPIPTAYVFDFRGSSGTANWLTRCNPIPREKPEISLAVSKAVEYAGIRFYILAGGSGSMLPPPAEHVKIISNKTNLFVIPTSGIKTTEHAEELFSSGADALQIGNLLESKEGFETLKKILKVSKNYPGKRFV